MKPEFEIKYIEVQWYNQEIITKITESLVNLSIEYNNELQAFECETTIYPNKDGLQGQLAIRFLHNKSVQPYIKLASDNIHYLNPIKDIDTNKIWWIVKNSWDEQNNLWRHTGINTAGTLKLILQAQTCYIQIGFMEFSQSQLEYYLASFKDDLWELILDESSAIQTDISKNINGINEALIECINHLIAHAEKILNTPKVELREIQTLKPRKFVKPVNRTFMELVSKTNQRFLTSRATTPTYNVPENRYILFVLERCYRIIRQLAVLSRNKQKRYANTVTKLQNQYDSFTDIIKINEELAIKELADLKNLCRLQYWQDNFISELDKNKIYLSSQQYDHDTFYICTKGYTYKQNQQKEKDGFFIKVFINGQWQEKIMNNITY